MLSKQTFAHAQKNSLQKEGRLSLPNLKNSEVIIYPRAQWTVRANETDSDYVICINIHNGEKKEDIVCTTLLFSFFNL